MSPQFGLYFWQTHIFLAVIIALYVIIKVRFSFKMKLAWVLTILFVPLLGSLAYLSVGRKYLKN